MNGLQLYWRFTVVNIRAEMLYPSSFVLRLTSQFFVTIIEFGGLWALFARFHHIRGWTFAQVALFYGIAALSFAIADALSRGFEWVGPLLIKTGNFDRILLRPRSTALQIVGRDIQLSSLGRFLQGVVVLCVAVWLLKPDWGVTQWLILAWGGAGGVALFFGLQMLEGVLAFWTTEALELVNLLTYGGEAAAQYPLNIYAAWFRKVLIYFVPIGCSLYFPVALVLGRGAPGVPPWLALLTPASGFAFLLLALGAWRIGIRHYTSTGS
jgi:ABC-2 type transport system permease protein